MTPDERARAIVDAAGLESAAGLHALSTRAEPVARLPIPDRSELERRASLGRRLEHEAAAIPADALEPELADSLAVSLFVAERWSRAEEWWLLVHDPLGLGFFGRFAPSAYCGGWLIETCAAIIERQQRGATAQVAAQLVDDLAGIVDALAFRLGAQRDAGRYMPVPLLERAHALVDRLHARCSRLTPSRSDRLEAAFGRFAEAVVAHEAGAGDAVGLAYEPGGAELYGELVRHYLTLDLTPEAVHRAGLERIAELREAMAEERATARFSGDDRAYREAVEADPRYAVSDADGIVAQFDAVLKRLEPHLGSWFRRLPRASYGAAPLPAALEASMTFGIYQPPPAPDAAGRFLFNTSNLVRSGTATIAAIVAHELVPGHHVHLARQLEQVALPPVRRYASFNAFNEGWAEYAAVLAGEAGVYASPRERFGRLVMEAFLTCRLVVDTGMNVMGWPLERAREYLREHAFLSEAEIGSETIRYSCDIPAQSLAYKLGDRFLLDLRARARERLGPAFDLRDFHEDVLGSGALPLPLVARRVERRRSADFVSPT